MNLTASTRCTSHPTLGHPQTQNLTLSQLGDFLSVLVAAGRSDPYPRLQNYKLERLAVTSSLSLPLMLPL